MYGSELILLQLEMIQRKNYEEIWPHVGCSEQCHQPRWIRIMVGSNHRSRMVFIVGTSEYRLIEGIGIELSGDLCFGR